MEIREDMRSMVPPNSSAIGGGHNAFGTTMVLAVFPELYAILGLLVLILIAGSIQG